MGAVQESQTTSLRATTPNAGRQLNIAALLNQARHWCTSLP